MQGATLTYDHSPANTALYTQRQTEPSYTLIVSHDECTGGSDAYLVQGTLPIPPDLREALHDTLYTKLETVDLKMAGRFPFDALPPNESFFAFEPSLKVTGKIIGTFHDESTEGTIPLFYVEKWEWSAIKR